MGIQSTSELQATLSISRRKAREAYLLNRGKTLSPGGLNRQEERWTVPFINHFIYSSIN